MSKLPQVTHSQHERTVDVIRCQTEHINNNNNKDYLYSAIGS